MFTVQTNQGAPHTRFIPFVVVAACCLAACKDAKSDAYATFLSDRWVIRGAAFEAKYPAGKTFEMAAKVREKGECGEAICDVNLQANDKLWMLIELPPTQTQVKDLKVGMTALIKCTPVYEGGSMNIKKSCTVSAG
jgi:hypothetical protein